MSLFGIFHGWQRKRPLLEKLQEEIKTDVLQIYPTLLENYKLKLDLINNFSQSKLERLKRILRVEQNIKNAEETNISRAIALLDKIIAKESISTDKSVEEQLKKELVLLHDNLLTLKLIIFHQYEYLIEDEFYFNLFEASVKDEGRYLLVEHDELEKILAELYALLAKPEIKSITPAQRTSELNEFGFPTSQYPEITRIFLQNWTLVETIKEKIEPARRTNFFNHLLDIIDQVYVAYAIKTYADLSAVCLFLIDVLRDTKQQNTHIILIYGLPAFNYLIKSIDDLKIVYSALSELYNLIGDVTDSTEIFKEVIRSPYVQNLVKTIDDLPKLYAEIPNLRIRAHRLYKKQSIEGDESFFKSGTGIVRREFEKTGSRIILLGGNLVGKVIVRVITVPAFLAWKQAFEAKDAWARAGFDYIPIEPILSKGTELRAYKIKNIDYYRVYTKVLGPSLLKFTEKNDKELKRQLYAIKDKIINVLEALGVSHGHLHEENFCVEFKDNKIRLYAIDFDRAIS